MKDKDKELSVEDLERLCNLYIECKLSVLEEAELYYVLLKTDKDSALINETRNIMRIERKVANSQAMNIRKKSLYKRFVFYGVAAVVIAVITITVCIFQFKGITTEKTPLLTHEVCKKISANPVIEKSAHIENNPEIQNQNGARFQKEYKKYTKSVKYSSPPKNLKPQPQETVVDQKVQEDYIEVTDKSEASKILQDINEKLMSALEKGRVAHEKIHDLNETTCNVLKKYKI